MRNLGPKSRAWLEAIGVRSVADLAEIGAVTAFLRIRQAGYRPTRNLLWALAGALRDVDWRTLTDAEKAALLRELQDADRPGL